MKTQTNKNIEFTISSEEELLCRLDRLLTQKFPVHSRNYFHYLFDQDAIRINDSIVKKRVKPRLGDRITIEFLEIPQINVQSQPITLNILYEDDHLLAIDKPAGIVVHPAPGSIDNTIVNGLLFHLKDTTTKLPNGHSLRPGIIHRLDKETSGVLLLAKTELAYLGMVQQFATRRIKKTYIAICLGKPTIQSIEAPIGRHSKHRQRMAIQEEGKFAQTTCVTIASNNYFSYVKLHPSTGRTHQIRVHLQSIHCPILGDKIYGNSKINTLYKTTRHFLHAYSLEFIHPYTKKSIQIIATIPEDIAAWVKKLS
ncbi:MAG: RluA family pseudouridine synthase [Chlamydiales bacterium]